MSMFALSPVSFLWFWIILLKIVPKPPSFPLLACPLPSCLLSFWVVARFLFCEIMCYNARFMAGRMRFLVVGQNDDMRGVPF